MLVVSIFALALIVASSAAASAADAPASAHPAPGSHRVVSEAWGYGTLDITGQPCSISPRQWFHLHINILNQGWQWFCLGGKGTWYFSANQTNVVCSGNNYGTFTYYDAHGDKHSIGYLPNFNQTWTSPFINTYSVAINGWSGSNECLEP